MLATHSPLPQNKALPSADLPRIAEQQLVAAVAVVDSQLWRSCSSPVRSCWRSAVTGQRCVLAGKPVAVAAEQLPRNVAQRGRWRQVENAGCSSGPRCSFHWAGPGAGVSHLY